MKLKIFLTACISALIISFPQNIIGCGPGIDPYDYYTSFFNRHLPDAKAYQPFYYTGYNFLYDEEEPVSAADELAKEWAGFCGMAVTPKEAKTFVTEYDVKDIKNLYYHIEKKQALQIPDSVQRNTMTGYFIKNKDLEGLGYIIYAKQAAPFVTGEYNSWEPVQRDSSKMSRLIKSGQQLYAAAKSEWYKLKYGYQVVRLAHYSGRYQDAIEFYDNYIAVNKTASILQPLGLSLKAGALYRTGNKEEATYLFSKAFSAAGVKRVSNYVSFKWSVDAQKERAEYLALCKNKEEKADMLALFALGSPNPQTAQIKEIFNLNAAAEVLQVLAVREIGKLEEKYYTPSLNKQLGGKAFYYTWEDEKNDSTLNDGRNKVNELQNLLHSIAVSGKAANAGLFETGAAYCALMTRDYPKTKEHLNNAAAMKLSAKVKDQWLLTNLLLSLNETQKIDAAFEKQILPSIQWLQQKALTTKKNATGAYEYEYIPASEWQIFYRNLMSEVLAKRYHQQGDFYKEALAVSAADRGMRSNAAGGYDYGVDFMRSNLQAKDVLLLFHLFTAKNNTAFDGFLIKNNSLKLSDVIDFAGTAYLRDHNFGEAISWFTKAGNAKKLIPKNPFIELLYDREESISSDNTTTTKLAFAKEMLRLQALTKKDKANAAKHFYKMALGFYNSTYYGYAWELVEYYRSGADGYYIPKGANNFKKNYYGCYTAHDYFKMAMDASADKSFKASCLFMMAKCAQKQVRMPQYFDFGSDYEKYDIAAKEYFPLFKNNRYFPQLVKEYSGTAFYKEAFNSCSYLRDFVEKK